MDPSSTVIAFPDRKGCVRIKTYTEEDEEPFSSSINAHDSGITQCTLNYDGSLLATSSEKGTLIRIFNTQKGVLIEELRRGKDKALIYSINFDFQRHKKPLNDYTFIKRGTCNTIIH